MNNADTPATAQSGFETMAGDIYNSDSCGGEGLSKREHFAAMAMQGIIGSGNLVGQDVNKTKVAQHAIEYADALLAEIDK
jgi:hypothetical protein